MNAIEGLMQIRQRLENQGARSATLSAVDDVIEAAQRQPGGSQASARSLGQLVKMLMRTPAANNNTQVYDDLSRLEEQLAVASARIQAEREAEESRPMPKSSKYYKELKKKQREEAEKQG